MKRFALLGAAGYIAPRHMRAIKETGNELVAACDRSDSVGVLDSYFPHTAFFTEQELLDRHLTKMTARGEGIDYLSICTPNYLHDSHIRYGLRIGADVICEKPLVLNPWNVDLIRQAEQESNHRVYTILQLRLHSSIRELKAKTERELKADPKRMYDVDLCYITSRGNWYYASWKGDEHKSGGVATNIGIHFYDMLQWVFGPVKSSTVHIRQHDRVAGYLELEHARVRYFLSINDETLPAEALGQRTFRTINIDGTEFEFSNGFTELHTESYRDILTGGGFGIEDARQAINIVYNIRNAQPIGLKGDYHPLARLPLAPHPFGW